MRKLFALASLIATVISVFIVFQVMQTIQYSYPLGTDVSFELLVGGSTVSKDQLIDDLVQMADAHKGYIVKPSTSAESYESQRDLIYFSTETPTSSSPVIVHGNTINWLVPGLSGQLVSARAMEESPLAGTYMLKANPSLQEALTQWANENGLTITWYEQRPMQEEVLSILFSGGMIAPWLSAQLLVVTLAMIWITLRLHTRAIQLLGGVTSTQIHRETMGILARLMILGGVLGIAFSGIFVIVVLGPANILLLLPPTMLVCLLSFAGLLLLIFFLSVVLGTGMDYLRFRRPVTGNIRLFCRIISAVALVLAMQTIPPAINLMHQAWQGYVQSGIAKRFGNTIAISFKDTDYLDTKEGIAESRRVVQSLSQKNWIITSLIIDSEIVIRDDERADYSQFVIVDPNYLHLMGMKLPKESGNSELEEVAFDSLPKAARAFLQEQLSLWVGQNTTFKEAFTFYEYHGEGFINLGQNASYNSAFTMCEHPLVIVLNVPVEEMDMAAFTLSLISTGNIMFTNPEGAKEACVNSSMYPYIASFDRVADVTLTTGQSLFINALLYLAITVVSLLSICACAIQCASSWALAHEEEVFLVHTAGIEYRDIYLPHMKSDLSVAIIPLVLGTGICFFTSPYSTSLTILLGLVVTGACFTLFTVFSYTTACRKTFMAYVLRED